MRVTEIRIFIHKAQLNKNRAQIFLNAVNSAPVIRYIKVRMSYQRDIAAAFVCFVAVNVFFYVTGCGNNIIVTEILKVNKVKRVIKPGVYQLAEIRVKKVAVRNIKQKFNIIHKRLHAFIDRF